jgi:hypothetical protein
LSAFLVPSRWILKLLRDLGFAFVTCFQKATN